MLLDAVSPLGGFSLGGGATKQCLQEARVLPFHMRPRLSFGWSKEEEQSRASDEKPGFFWEQGAVAVLGAHGEV